MIRTLLVLSSASVFIGASVSALPPPVQVDVTGATLDFNNDIHSGNLSYYPNIFEVGTDCVSAYMNWTETSNVDNISVDEDGLATVGMYLVGDQLGPPDANDREPALSDVVVDFRIVFGLNRNCNTDDSDDDDVTLTGVCFNIKDIDDMQFVSVQGSPTFQVLDGPLTVDNTGGVVTVSETAGIDSEDDQQENWAEFSFASVSLFDFSLGIRQGGDGYAGFDIDFQCAPWGSSSGWPKIDLDHYREGTAQAEDALPNTK